MVKKMSKKIINCLDIKLQHQIYVEGVTADNNLARLSFESDKGLVNYLKDI
jgi:hypothetical protein